MSTRAEVVKEGAKVSRNYHVVIVFMWNLWNVTKVFPCHCKSTKFFCVSCRNFSLHCHYIPSSISKSHGSSKINFTALKEALKTFSQKSKHHLLRNRRSKCTGDDLWPDLYGIYLIIIPNEREFYELQVVKIVDQKVNCSKLWLIKC